MQETAPLKLARIFTDHMVLQCDLPVRVWGHGEPGETITVAFAGRQKSATVAPGGAWRVLLDALPACAQGRDMVVSASADDRRVVLRDIVVGEVWICSGQSNMVMPLRGQPAADRVVSAADALVIRACYVNVAFEAQPRDDLVNPDFWEPCSAVHIGDYSAVGMFFAERIARELKVPVGILIAAMGGSRIEAWTPHEALAAAEPGRTFLLNDRAMADLSEPQREFFGIGGDQHLPSRLYNAMIAPLTPMTARGVVWYQGESNAGPPGTDPVFGRRPDASDYGQMLERFIGAWRQAFARDDLAFVMVQLPRYDDAMWPLVREGQRACTALPHTAMAVTIDTGSRDDGHPVDKEPVGTRAALAALGKTYNRKLVYSGPVYRSMRVAGATAEVAFDHVGRGLTVREGKLDGFEVAGADGTFAPADGVAAGGTVTLSNPTGERISSVRYAWAGFPECSLYNAEGLPAGPFRAEAGTTNMTVKE